MPRLRRSGEAHQLYAMEEQLSTDFEEEWSEKERSEKSIFSFLPIGIGVLIVTVIGALIYAKFALPEGNSGEEKTVVAPIDKSDFIPIVKISSYLETSTGQEIRDSNKKTLQGFMEAQTAQEKCRHIMGGEALLPQMLEYESRPDARRPRGFQEMVLEIPNSIASIPYWSARAKDLDGKVYEFIMIPTDDGMKIDWACSMEYGELSLQEFLTTKPEKPVRMRLMVAHDPLRNVDGVLNYFIASDTTRKYEFSLHITDEFFFLKNLLGRLRGRPIRQPLQLEIFWNAERKMAEVRQLNYIWWFDIDSINLEAPELTATNPIVEVEEE